MNNRDILNEISTGTLKEEQVEKILAEILRSNDAEKVESRLMLTRMEWTAYCHGATFSELSRWRDQGWPTQCILCGREIEVDKFGWKVIDKDGISKLRHIRCP